MNRASYKATAKQQLIGNWGALILMCFIYGIFFGVSNTISLRYSIDSSVIPPIYVDPIAALHIVMTAFFVALIVGMAFIIVIVPLIHGALTVGESKYLVDFVECGKTDLNTLFVGFKNYKSNYLLSFWYNLYLCLWTLIPVMGIIKNYSYSLTFYLKAIHPEYSTKECITKSRQYVDGYKWDLFVLDLSFIGWLILCVLTLGIGMLWLNPYMQVTKANIYHDMLVTHDEITNEEEKGSTSDIDDGLNGII